MHGALEGRGSRCFLDAHAWIGWGVAFRFFLFTPSILLPLFRIVQLSSSSSCLMDLPYVILVCRAGRCDDD